MAPSSPPRCISEARGARNAERFAPVFILTSARSYSSVVCSMIGQHPDLAGLPELKLFAYPTVGELEDSLPRYWTLRGVTHRSPGLVRAVAQCRFHGQDLESLALARAWLKDRRHWDGASVLDCLLETLAPRAGVEKSPENALTNEALDRLSSAYPRACYLHLTRHPVTTQRSAEEHWNRVIPGHPQSGEPMAGIAAWVETHSRILRFAASLGRGHYLRVRAEDALNDSRRTLGLIADWLGVSGAAGAVEAMLHPELSPFACFGPEGSGVTGGHDPGFLRSPAPRRVEVPLRVEQPAGWIENGVLWRETVELARRLGYQ